MSGKEDIMLCRMTASHWKDNQMVPTYFVSQKPRKGYYTRIKEAIQRVPPYSRIEIVGGGTFREKVIVDKPVELGVAKASDPTSICSSSTALVLQTNECHIEGLIIEVESLTATPSCSVSIPTGSPTLKWCTVQSIEVSGTATPTVTECKILDSKAHGLLLTEASGGTYVRNSIYGHVGYSVLVESTGEPQLSYNNISCSGLGAISVKGSDASSKVCPRFMLNRISSAHATARTTVAAAHENGILPGYKLDGLEVKEVGMKVSLMPMDHYAPVMLSDDMATGGDDDAIVNNNNTRCAVLISGTYAEPILTRNNISNCADHGLWLRGGCGGTYEGNYVASNKGWGIVVEGSKTHATFEANHVNSNTGGMKITGSPILVQGENILSGNRGPQVYIANPHADFVFQKNKVQSGSRIGVWCTGSGGGLFTQNVFENSAVAFRVELLADPVVQDCSFELCAIGVYASMASRGKFTHCTFSECSFSSVVSLTQAEPHFADCQFSLGGVGVTVSRNGRGTFEQCRFRDLLKIGIDVHKGGDPIVHECRVRSCGSCGVHVSDNGKGTFLSNVIAGHEGAPVYIETGGDPVLERNVIGHTAVDGVVIGKGGLGTLLHNVIRVCYESGISVSGVDSAPTLRSNYISNCMAFGMLIVEGLEGTYEYNTVIQCGKAGVRVSGKSLLDTSSTYTKAAGGAKKADGRREKNSPSRTCVVLRENTIADSLQAGIVVEREGNVLMRGNTITNCTQAVAVRGGSTVCFVQNVVERCLHGFLSDEEATVQLLANRFEHIEGVTVCSLGCQSLRVLWNVITHSGTAFFLRRVVNGSISDNILDSIYKYGFFLGMECHVTVTRNRLLRNGVGICFGEPQCKAEVLDNIIRDSTCHGIRIAGDHMDRARCMYNLVLGGETGACVYPADLTLSYNVFLNCKKGVVIAAPNTTPAQPALKPSTSLSKAQRKLKNMMPSASVAKTAEGITSLSSTVNGATSATAPNTNQKGARFVGCLFSCCSHGGVATAFSNTVLERCLLLHNDVGFHFLGPHASAQLERSIIANSAAIGLYGEQKSAGVVRQCCLFKNYINVACESDTVLRCERTVLQAPVVFNSYSSGPLTKPVFEHCLLSSSALMSAKQQMDSTKKKDTAEEKQGAERNSVLMVLRTIVRIENADDDDKAARHLTFALPQHKKGGGEEEAKRAVLTISENDAARWSFVPSLWLDLYEETPAWRYASDSQHASYFAGKPFPCADRRSAILWPRNHNERAVLGGPGGPFRLHRVCTDRPVAAQDDRTDEMESSTRPSSYVYACSGVWLEDSAAPTFEGSFIGSHISVGTSATILLGPNTADGEEWLVNPVAARQERQQHADPEGATAETPPESKKKNKKKEIKRKKSDATREETPHDAAEEVTPAPTASFSPTYDPPLLHVRPSDENISPLAKLLLVGSPCYWRYYAESSDYFAKTAGDGFIREKRADLANFKPTSTAGDNTAAARKRKNTEENALYTQGITYNVSTAMTEHLAGYGVLANSNASGQFSNCLFDSNQHAARLGLGARTVFRRCRFFRQAGEAILLGDRCKGDIVNCIFKDTRSIHLRVVGPGTTPKIEGNDFSTETPFTAILCEDRCAPQIMGNKLSFIQNSAIVVQEKAQPEIAKNTFDRCKSGVLISSESKGKMGGNSFTTMSEFAFKITGYDTKPVIDENSILGGKAVGILVHGYGAAPTVKYNSLDENVVGLRLQEGAEGEFTHNTFRRHDTAIHVDDCGGYFTGNNIYDSTEAGIKVLGSHAMPYFVRNTVQSGKKTGLWITGGQGRFTCNAISLNGTSGGLLEGAATQFVFVANEFHNNGGCGLAVTGGGTPQLYCNVFTENKRGGVEVSDKQTAPVLEGNYFKHNFRHGILFRSGAAGKMQTSVFTATQEGPAVVVDDEAEPSFEDLVLFNNGSGGLLVKPGGTCTALRCLFVRNVGEAACTVKGNETTITKLTGCVFVENSCSLLAAAATNTELTACAFLGQHSDGPAVTVTKDASPSFTHCLFALAKCGLASTGHARLKRSIFYDCNTGAELQDGGTSLFECEVLAGGTGVNITGGLPSLMGSLFASCTKSGITVSGGAPSISECGVLRCAKGLTLDGSAEGSVENNRIFWNQENILVNDNAATEIRNNLIYDAVSIGVHVRNGAPKLMNNVIFDNLYAGVAVDGATGGKLEGNDIYFPRDDGALVVKDKGDTKKVFSTASNTLRNGISPPGCAQYKTLAERQQQYKAVENEKEKSYANYVDLRKLIDETTAFTLLRVTEMASRSVASSHKVQWLLKDGKDDDADGSPLSPTNGGKEAVDHHLEPFASRWDKLSSELKGAALQVKGLENPLPPPAVASSPSSPQASLRHGASSTSYPPDTTATVALENGLPPTNKNIILFDAKRALLLALDNLIGPSASHRYETLLQREPYASANTIAAQVRLTARPANVSSANPKKRVNSSSTKPEKKKKNSEAFASSPTGTKGGDLPALPASAPPKTRKKSSTAPRKGSSVQLPPIKGPASGRAPSSATTGKASAGKKKVKKKKVAKE